LRALKEKLDKSPPWMKREKRPLSLPFPKKLEKIREKRKRQLRQLIIPTRKEKKKLSHLRSNPKVAHARPKTGGRVKKRVLYVFQRGKRGRVRGKKRHYLFREGERSLSLSPFAADDRKRDVRSHSKKRRSLPNVYHRKKRKEG